MKSVLVMVPNLNGGGAERVAVNLANRLAADGRRVSLLVIQDTGVYFDQISSKVDLCRLSCKRVAVSLLPLLRALRRIDPDTVLATTHRMNVMAYLAKSIGRGAYRLLLRLPNSPKLELENGAISRLQRSIYSFVYSRADRVVCQTNEMRDEAVRYLRVSKRNAVVLHNPLDRDLIDSQVDGIPNPFVPGQVNFVAAGRLHYQKGFDLLIDAFSEVAKKLDHSVLYIIGNDVGEGAKLKEQVERLGLREKVHFLAFQSNPYVFFKYCDAFVLASRWEGLPNTVLECLYLGTPVIATKSVTVLQELIDDGVNGFLVEKNDARQLSEAMLEYKTLGSSTTSNGAEWPSDLDVLFVE